MRKLEAKDVLPNMNRRKGCKMPVLSLVTLTFDLGLQTRFGARDQTRLPCEFGANLFSGPQDISYTNKKPTDWQDQKTEHSTVDCVW